MDFDYDENDLENKYDKYNNWEIRIDNEPINTFDNKYDAIDSLIEEINILYNDDAEKVLIDEYIDYDDLINELINMSSYDFYEYISCMKSKLELDNDIRLICLNDDEPEFGEL